MDGRSTSSLVKIAIIAAVVAGVAGVAAIYIHLQHASEKANRQQELSYQRDSSEFEAVDPKLLKYKQIEQIKTGFIAPTAVAVDNGGRVIVGGDKALKIFDKRGPIEVELGAMPTCVAAREDGSILVGLKDHVEVFSSEGKKTAAWPGFGEDSYITSIATHGEDAFIGDAGRKCVVRCDATGKIASPDQFKPIEGLTIFSAHLDVAIAPDGVLWVADPGKHHLLPFTRNGRPTRGAWGEWGKSTAAFAGCCNPSDFTILPSGNFVTSEKGTALVKVCRIDGTLDCVVADLTMLGRIEGSMDLACDGEGRVYVLDPASKSVRVFARKENSL